MGLEPALLEPTLYQRPWVTFIDLKDELGPLLDRLSAIFSGTDTETIVMRWVKQEEEIIISELAPELYVLLDYFRTKMLPMEEDPLPYELIYRLKKACLCAVCSRILSRADSSRRNMSEASYRASRLWYEGTRNELILQLKLELSGLSINKEDYAALQEED